MITIKIAILHHSHLKFEASGPKFECYRSECFHRPEKLWTLLKCNRLNSYFTKNFNKDRGNLLLYFPIWATDPLETIPLSLPYLYVLSLIERIKLFS